MTRRRATGTRTKPVKGRPPDPDKPEVNRKPETAAEPELSGDPEDGRTAGPEFKAGKDL